MSRIAIPIAHHNDGVAVASKIIDLTRDNLLVETYGGFKQPMGDTGRKTREERDNAVMKPIIDALERAGTPPPRQR